MGPSKTSSAQCCHTLYIHTCIHTYIVTHNYIHCIINIIYIIHIVCIIYLNSYLSNRSQYVISNNAQSTMLNVDYGVPQGSVLGPLLFLIYNNDIGNIPNLPAYPKKFADDTNIFISASNLIKLSRDCQD